MAENHHFDGAEIPPGEPPFFTSLLAQLAAEKANVSRLALLLEQKERAVIEGDLARIRATHGETLLLCDEAADLICRRSALFQDLGLPPGGGFAGLQQFDEWPADMATEFQRGRDELKAMARECQKRSAKINALIQVASEQVDTLLDMCKKGLQPKNVRGSAYQASGHSNPGDAPAVSPARLDISF